MRVSIRSHSVFSTSFQYPMWVLAPIILNIWDTLFQCFVIFKTKADCQSCYSLKSTFQSQKHQKLLQTLLWSRMICSLKIYKYPSAVLAETPATYILMYCNASSTAFPSVHCFQFNKKVLELNATLDQSSDRTLTWRKRSFMKMLNSIGPSTFPCGTPRLTFSQVEKVSPTLTL